MVAVIPKAGAGTSVLLVNAPYPGHQKFDGEPSSLLHAVAPFVARVGPAGLGLLDLREPGEAAQQELEEVLRAAEVRVVLISTSTAAIETAAELVRLVKQVRPEALVVAGGPHEDDVEPKMAATLQGVDISVAGEAELLLDVLLQDFLSADLSSERFCQNLHSRLRRLVIPVGRFQVTSRVEGGAASQEFDFGTVRLDELPPRPVSSRPVRFEVFEAERTLPVMISRGCSYGRCTFCSEPAASRGQATTTSFEWLPKLSALHPQAAIYFQDSIFPATRPVMETLLPLLRDLGVEWGCQLYLPATSARFIEALARHGCSYIYTGLESASSEVLERIGKRGLSPALAIERLGWARDAGIRVGVSLMFGSLSANGTLLEDENSIPATVAMAHDIVDAGVDVTGFYPNVLTVLPGTELSRSLERAGFHLDFYRMPRARLFEDLEDGAVGYNFLTLADPTAQTGRIAGLVKDAALLLTRCGRGARPATQANEAPARQKPPKCAT